MLHEDLGEDCFGMWKQPIRAAKEGLCWVILRNSKEVQRDGEQYEG